MNRKQLISMWCGIVAIVFFGFITIVDSYQPEYGRLAVCIFITALITGGLIYTFKDRKRSEVETRKPVNLKRGFRKLTLLLAIVATVICGSSAIVALIDKRVSSQKHLAKCEEEFSNTIPVASTRLAGWPEWSSEKWTSYSDYLLKLSLFLSTKQANLPSLSGDEDKKFREEYDVPPDSTKRFYTEESIKFIKKYGSCVEKANSVLGAHNYWVELSTKQFVGLLALIGLGGAIAGFCGVWLCYFIAWLVYKLITWVTFGFRTGTG